MHHLLQFMATQRFFLIKEENINEQLSPYALTKYIDELYANMFFKLYGIECIGLRYFNVFGPRQSPNGDYAAVIPKFISLIKSNQNPIIYGDGSFSRDFVYVENVALANYLALTTMNEDAFGQSFNIGSGIKYTILELFNIINNNFGNDIKPIFGKERIGDIPHSYADISKANKTLTYNTKINFDEGIKKTVKLFK